MVTIKWLGRWEFASGRVPGEQARVCSGEPGCVCGFLGGR